MICATFELQSAKAYTLIKSKILLFSRELMDSILYQTTTNLDWSKLKAFADVKMNVEICFGKGRKHCVKRRKCWLTAFSPFFHNVFKKVYI